MRTTLLVAVVLVMVAGACGGGSKAAAPAQEPAPPPPPAEITCDQVADRAMELIFAGLDAQAAGMTPEQKANGRAAAEQAAPEIRAEMVQNCKDANWSQPDRQCVMDAQTVEAASACGG